MYFWLNFAAMLLFFSIEYSINAVLPLFITDMGYDKSLSGVVTGIYSAAAMLSKFSCGAMADKIGRMRLYTASFVVVGIVAFFYSAAAGVTFLIVIRAAHGLSAGVLRALSHSVTASVVPKEKIGLAIGVMGISAMAAMVVAAPAGVSFVEYFSYPSLAWTLGGIGLVSAVLVAFIRVDDVKSGVKLSLKSFIEKSVIYLAVCRFLGAICYGLFLSYAVLHGKGYSFNPGFVITVYAFANLMGRPLSGWILDRANPRYVILISYIILFAGYAVFSVNNGLLILAGAFVIGIGGGIEYTAINATALKRAGEKALNRASATIEFFFSLGIASSSILSGLFFRGSLSSLYIFAASVCAALVLSMLVLFRRYPSR